MAPQPEHRLRGEKCERVKKEAPQPRGRCSLQHGAPVEEQTCFLVGNNFGVSGIWSLFIHGLMYLVLSQVGGGSQPRQPGPPSKREGR